MRVPTRVARHRSFLAVDYPKVISDLPFEAVRFLADNPASSVGRAGIAMERDWRLSMTFSSSTASQT
jgi:hypothetical protein